MELSQAGFAALVQEPTTPPKRREEASHQKPRIFNSRNSHDAPSQESTMPDFRQVASQLNQAKEEVAGVWIRILEVDEGDAPEDHPLEEHMRAVDVLFERAMEDLDPMNSRAEEIVSGYCEMALSVFSDARSAAFHSKFREVPARQSLKAVHELAEMATARAFREAAEEEDAIV